MKKIKSLDGLRSLAVLSVMAFHFGLPTYGGFIGVDAFFVLSGFLITKLLLEEINSTGSIKLSHFWVRRIRRLIPASFLVLASVVVYEYFASSFSSRLRLVPDLQATLAYLANWKFISNSSYFADDGTTSPLLHMWSLAVEEQFYIVWPLILIALTRIKIKFTKLVFAFALSLSVSSVALMTLLYNQESPERAYMGTDTRAFQLALGASLAAFISYKPLIQGSSYSRSAAALTGFGFLGYSTIAMGSKSGPINFYFNGGAYLVGLAASLIIWALWSGDSYISRILSNDKIVYLGKISYGMYLWHWPLQILLRPKFGGELGLLPQVLILFLLTILLASASYHLVENPIRSSSNFTGWAPRQFLSLTFILMLVFAIFASTLLTRNPSASATSGNKKIVMLVGDSVPSRLTSQFDDYATTQGWMVINGAKGSCGALTSPLVNPDGTNYGPQDLCVAQHAEQLSLLNRYRPSVIIWMSRYELSDRMSISNKHLNPSQEDFWIQNQIDLYDRIDEFTQFGAHVVLVPIEPTGIGIYSRCTANDCHWFLNRLISSEGVLAQNRWNGLLAEAAQEIKLVDYFSISNLVCKDEKVPCDDTLDGKTIRPDGTHFTSKGAQLFISKLVAYAIGKTQIN